MSRSRKKKTDAEPVKEVEKPTRHIKEHRRCPICWNGRGGYGNSYSKKGITSYYACNSCSHTWTVDIRVEVVKVEHRTVDLKTRGQ